MKFRFRLWRSLIPFSKGNREHIYQVKGEYSKPRIIGRTDQLYFTTEIIPDLKGIDSTKSVFKDAFVICK